jgi:hypothetical protein
MSSTLKELLQEAIQIAKDTKKAKRAERTKATEPSRDHDDDNHILRASDCPPEPVEWLWPNKFPIGKVTLLIGDPGNGKSLVAADIAARVSRGVPFPDQKAACPERVEWATAGRAIDNIRQGDKENGRQGESNSNQALSLSPCLPISPSSVLILSAEDELADTIRPRLDAAGANCDRIFFLPDIKDLRHEFHKLRSALDCVTDCRLLIIDPINAYVGPSDSHFQTVTQRIMEPLARLAAEKRIAVVAVAHFRKSEGAAIYRAAGSLGFVSTARAVWTICRDDSQPGRHLLLPLKCNLAKAVAGLTFTIQSDDVTGAPVIHWSDLPVTTPTADVLAMNAKKRGPEAIELHDASVWLRKALASGRQMADEVTRAGQNLGFHERTLRRALHAIGGEAQKGEPWEGWWWSIPKAEGGRGKAEGTAGASKCTAGCLSPSTLPLPPSEKPVLFDETCPLPGNINTAPPETCPLPEILSADNPFLLHENPAMHYQ